MVFHISSSDHMIQPPFGCPILPANYTIKRSEVNLKIYSFLPMDGYVFNEVLKFVATDPVKKTRKLVSCFRIELKIERVRVKTL
jgi:hypothetical protein